MKQDITPEQVRELFDYDPITGNFTRRVAGGKSKRFAVGSVAGSRRGDGYMTLRIGSRKDGARYYAHRLAWLFVYGEWPSADIDHIDGNPSNNAISNLRDVPASVNRQNLRRHMSHNKAGVLGVALRSPGRWGARITIDAKMRYLGTFSTPEAAHAAYLDAKRRLHEGCTL